MSIASEITRINNNIAAAYTAASGKGATMPATQNSANLATCIGSISGGGGSGKYQLLDRVKDDSNNEIGTVSGFFTDANNTEYAVVCLDAQYRNSGAQYLSEVAAITGLPQYNDIAATNFWESKETSTYNCDAILTYCTDNAQTSSAVTHCRSQTFTIDGVSYAGQLPNILELTDIAKHFSTIESKDTSSSSNPTLNFATKRTLLSSSQNGNGCIDLSDSGTIKNGVMKTNNIFTCPVLEIPNAV